MSALQMGMEKAHKKLNDRPEIVAVSVIHESLHAEITQAEYGIRRIHQVQTLTAVKKL